MDPCDCWLQCWKNSSFTVALNEQCRLNAKCISTALWYYQKQDQWAFSTADILACHSKQSAGVINTINNGSIPFKCISRQRASMQNSSALEQVVRNGVQPLLILLITKMVFLLWHVKVCNEKANSIDFASQYLVSLIVSDPNFNTAVTTS